MWNLILIIYDRLVKRIYSSITELHNAKIILFTSCSDKKTIVLFIVYMSSILFKVKIYRYN